MANTLSKTGIATDGTITAAHITQSIDALTGTQDYDITITGNTVVANLTASGDVDFNGNLDVDGITNLDVVDIDGAVDMASTLVVASHITSSGNISSSGTLIGGGLDITGTTTFNDGNITNVGSIDVDTIRGDAATSVTIALGSNGITFGAEGGDQYQFNLGEVDADFKYFDNTETELVHFDAALARVGIADTSPSSKLDVNGDLLVQSHITASANISASGVITAEGLVISDDASITDDVSIGGKLDVVDLISGSVIRAKKHGNTINNAFGTINQTLNPATSPAGTVTGITQTTSNNAVTITLPAVEAGLSYEFIATANSTGTGATTFSAPSSNLLHGIAICDDGTEDIDGTNFIIAATKFVKGTRVYCVSDGTIWHITAFCLCTVSDVSHS